MVNSEWRPRIRIVARFATISGIDMGGRSAARRHAVMALDAIAGYTGVIERGAKETRRGMAQVALLCSRNVCR